MLEWILLDVGASDQSSDFWNRPSPLQCHGAFTDVSGEVVHPGVDDYSWRNRWLDDEDGLLGKSYVSMTSSNDVKICTVASGIPVNSQIIRQHWINPCVISITTINSPSFSRVVAIKIYIVQLLQKSTTFIFSLFRILSLIFISSICSLYNNSESLYRVIIQ